MSHSMPNYPTLDDWIAHEAIPFRVDSSASFRAAVDQIIAALGNTVELLGFGEPLHGGEDILLLRNRLFQHLVENHGYSAIAIESSFPRAQIVNAYIAGHGPASYDAVQDSGLSPAFGRLEANRELVEWMRQQNANPARHVKLHFYGFDIPNGTIGIASPRQVLSLVLEYLTALDPNSGREHRTRIDMALGDDADWENPAAMMDHTRAVGLSPKAAELCVATEALLSALHIRGPELIALSSKAQYAEARHYGSMARQLLNFHAAMAKEADYSARLGVRDALMADNLAYVVSCERGRGKVFAFAHNSYLKQGRAEWQIGAVRHTWWPAGSQIKAQFGARYAVIGSAIGVSAANGIGQPEVGTLEYRLTTTPGPGRFIPTHNGHGLPLEAVAALTVRSGSHMNPTYVPLTAQSFTDFDWFAVLDATEYQRGGPPLQAWDATPQGGTND